ncbi:MAG: hypothetical protein AAF620_19920 [Bacteroidota bacterium]
MIVEFRTKDQSNKIQEEDFLSLSPADRIYFFLNLMMKSKKLPSKDDPTKKDNFIIELNTSEKSI